MTQLHRLSSAFIKSAPHGKHSDGQGLWLIKRTDGGAQWVLRISLGGKRREMGLGSVNEVSLKEARELASEYRKLAKKGIDPINSRLAEKRALLKPGKSLMEISQAAYEAKKAELKNDGINARWFSPLQLHVLPKLGRLSVEVITQQDIAEALQPIWHQKAATAKKAIGRLSIVLTYAAAAGYDVDLNAIAKAKALLGKHRHQTQNIPALAWRQVPDFYSSLTEPTIIHLALKLLILTGVRSYAIRNAHLDQFDGDTWIIPAENMKGQITQTNDFHVPLSTEAQIVISTAMHFARDGFLFPGIRSGVISDASLARLMQRRGMTERPHGFRSSLRTWLAETTNASEQVAETILAHKVGTKTIRAYRRTDHFEERSVLMERWARHVTGEENVIELTR
ncbi:integrase arm-type DNA-binding domain-containing protein [Paracoccaceae bacterium]|nr:integrase arm-type DNA-binding domain-containing protein [Paracoccaceae bacterium]